MLVSLVDEVPGQAREVQHRVTLGAPVITVRELIQARLELEVERYRDEADQSRARWLVVPGRARGGVAAEQPDIEALVKVALDGFARGSFFVLINDRQVTELDEAVPLVRATEVIFLRLTPLQGG